MRREGVRMTDPLDIELELRCKYCDYQATQKINLTSHIQSKHEGIKYACNLCVFQTTIQSKSILAINVSIKLHNRLF